MHQSITGNAAASNNVFNVKCPLQQAKSSQMFRPTAEKFHDQPLLPVVLCCPCMQIEMNAARKEFALSCFVICDHTFANLLCCSPAVITHFLSFQFFAWSEVIRKPTGIVTQVLQIFAAMLQSASHFFEIVSSSKSSCVIFRASMVFVVATAK